MCSKCKLIFLITLILFLYFPFTIFAQVSINEFLPDSTTEWIEFYNASDSADYIKAYYIDDDIDFLSDSGSSAKKSLTGLNISNPVFPYFETTSFLNNSGDFVVLFDEAGTVLDQYQYNNNPGQNMTIGRYPDGSGTFYNLVYSTKADANPAPPTPTSTPTQTATATATSTSIATVTATATPTKTATTTSASSVQATSTPFEKPIVEPNNDEEPIVISNTETIIPTGIVAGVSTTKKSPILSIFFIFFGLLFLGYGGYLLYNNKRNEKSVNQQ